MSKAPVETTRRRRRLADLPWLALLTFLLLYVIVILVASGLLFAVIGLRQDAALAPLIQQTLFILHYSLRQTRQVAHYKI